MTVFVVAASYLAVHSVQAADVSLQDFIDFNIPNGHEELTIKNVPIAGDINLANVNKGEDSFEADLDLVLAGFGISGKIEYNNGFEAKCYFKLPTIFTSDQFDGQVHSDEFDLKIDHDGVHISGDITFINQIHFPPVTLDKIRLQFNTDEKDFTGTVTVVAIEPIVGTFDGEIGFKNGQLEHLSFSGTEAGLMDLNNFVAFSKIDGEFKNLDDLSHFEIDGDFDIGIMKLIAFSDLRFVDLDGSGTIQPIQRWFDLSGDGKILTVPVTRNTISFRPAFNLSLTGEVDYPVAPPLAYFQTKTNLQFDKTTVSGGASGNIRVPDWVPIIGGDTYAGVEADFGPDGFSGSVSIQLTPEIHEECVGGCSKHCVKYLGCKTVCTPKVCIVHHHDGVTKKVGFHFDINSGNISFNNAEAYRGVPDWEIPFNVPFDAPGDDNGAWRFMTNWVRATKTPAIGGGSVHNRLTAGEPVTAFTVDEGHQGVIFRITYAGDSVSFVDAELSLPDGRILPVEAGPLPAGFDGVNGYARFNHAAREAFFYLHQPQSGGYVVTLNDSAGLGEYSVEMLVQVPEPRLDILAVNETGTEGVWNVDFTAEAYTEDATINVFLTEHLEQDQTGFFVAAYPADSADGSLKFDANSLSLPSGDYYVMMSIEDGMNDPVHAYDFKPLTIEHDAHPQPVSGVAIGYGDESFTVEWNPSNDDSVTHYLIAWTERSLPGVWERSTTVSADEQTCTVNGLRNGVPLLVSVKALNADGQASKVGQILRVVPRKPNSPAPPVITSTPDADATAGYTFVYQPYFYDADVEAITHEPGDGGQSDDEPFYAWELLEAPEGMEIHESGLIVWTPSEDQIGEHHCVLLLSDLAAVDDQGMPAVSVQEFPIQVLPSHNMNGVEHSPFVFMTQPFLSARQGERYKYHAQVLAPEGQASYSLISAPAGMDIDETGLISWEVGDNAQSGVVRIEADVYGKKSEQAFYLFVESDENSIAPESALNSRIIESMK